MVTAGTLVAGKYRVDHILGRGGMGSIAAATHIHLHQRVALKFLHPEYAASPEIVERFVREARAAGQLRGEHVCRVSDVGALDDGAPYIVMELLEGTDLARLVARNGPVPLQGACGYVLQACCGLAEAHALGIVHRDLKPANLFLAQRPGGAPIVKILDFGIAKAPGADIGDFSLTTTKGVLGSPGYMSPEQLRSTRDVDRRSDIWSLGVILYELVAGQPPFNAESITELAIRVWSERRPPFAGHVPRGFDDAIDRCLAKKPAERFSDLASLAAALAPYAGPDGAELAAAVARMLGAAPAPAGPSGLADAIADDAVTVPPGGFTAPPLALPAQRPEPSGAMPTTLGASASALSVRRDARPRWGVIATVAAVLIAGGATYAMVAGGKRSGGEPASESPAVAQPAPPATAQPPEPSPPSQPSTVAQPAAPAPTAPAPTAPASTALPDAGTAAAATDPAAAAPPSSREPTNPALSSSPPRSTPAQKATAARSDAARSDAARSDAARPDAARPDAARPDAAKSDASSKKKPKKPARPQTEDFGASRF